MPVLTDATIVLDGVDLSGDANEITLEFSRADHDATNFRSGGAKERKAGMSDTTGTVAGFWTPEVDAQVDTLAGATGHMIIASSAAVGSPAFVMDAKFTGFSRGGEVDGLIPFNASFGNAGRWGATRGIVVHNPTTVLTAPAAGPGQQLGSIGEFGYIDFHVHVIAGTVDVDIESSPSNGWSLPEVEESAEALTAGDVEIISVSGPVTNSWWRVNVTAVSGDALVLVTAEVYA